MDFPPWVLDVIRSHQAPQTGEVVIVLERYMGGVTSIKIGGHVRFKPPHASDAEFKSK